MILADVDTLIKPLKSLAMERSTVVLSDDYCY